MKIIYLLEELFYDFLEKPGLFLFSILLIVCVSYAFFKGMDNHLREIDNQPTPSQTISR